MVHQGFKQGPKHENMWCEPGTASKGKRRAGERVLLDWLGEGGNVSIQSVRSKGKAGQKCKGSFPLSSLSFTPSLPPSFPRLLFIPSLYSFSPSFVLCWKFRFVYETSWFVIQLISFYCINKYMWAKQTVPASPEWPTNIRGFWDSKGQAQEQGR